MKLSNGDCFYITNNRYINLLSINIRCHLTEINHDKMYVCIDAKDNVLCLLCWRTNNVISLYENQFYSSIKQTKSSIVIL